MAQIATALLPATALEVISEIYKTSLVEPNHTPRSIESLTATAARGDLVILEQNGTLAGWGIREDLTRELKEVGLMFIKPEFRSASTFIALARELSNVPVALILATYDEALIRQAVLEFGFREATLLQVILRSRGRFLTKRLNRTSRRAVAEHTRNAKPLFAIRESN